MNRKVQLTQMPESRRTDITCSRLQVTSVKIDLDKRVIDHTRVQVMQRAVTFGRQNTVVQVNICMI